MANIIGTIENGKMKRFCSCCQNDFTTISMWGVFVIVHIAEVLQIMG